MAIEIILAQVLLKAILESSTGIFSALQEDAKKGIEKAKATDNPWDDVLAGFWGVLVGVSD